MGLAGASTKRKISEDPRNTRWRNNTDGAGFKMLTAMGWTPESTTLNPASSMSAAPRKALTSIPSAKDDTLGIGATPSTSASSVFARFGSKGLKFVTAGANDAELSRHRKTEGGEFASLLGRLNTSASASPAPVSAGEEANDGGEGKRRKKKRKREVVVEVEPSPEPVLLSVRNSSRARHIAAKRMASSSAADLAGILGYELPVLAPTPSLPTPIVLPASTEAIAETPQSMPTDDSPDLAAQTARKAARKAKRKAERAALLVN